MTRTIIRDMIIMSRGRNEIMKEILQSKVMMGFIILVLGVTYCNSLQTHKLDETNIERVNEVVAINMK